jgi:uncharacterized protein YodC (DUF2158 family)
MASKFKAGDLVELKSGGPVMTIEKVHTGFGNEMPSYACTWFAGAKENHKNFTEAALKKADDDA